MDGPDNILAAAGDARPHALSASGWALLRGGNPRGAMRQFTSALAVDPEHLDALAGLSQAHLDVGELDAATGPAKAMLTLAPNVATGHRLKTEILRRRRKTREALAAAQEAVRLDPDEPVGYHVLALVQYDLKDMKAALATVRQGRALAPGYSILMAQEAQILLQMKGGRAAQPAIDEALLHGLDNDYVVLIAGRIALARNRLRDARELLDSVLQRDANDEEALSLYLLTDRKRHGILRRSFQFPFWRKEHGVLGWIGWLGFWTLLIGIAGVLVVVTHAPGILVGLAYRGFMHLQYAAHRREVKAHFTQFALKSSY